MESASYYRQRAAEVMAEAEKVHRAEIKEQFLAIAAQYEEIADMIEGSRRHAQRSLD